MLLFFFFSPLHRLFTTALSSCEALTNESLIFPEQAQQKQLEQEGIKGSDRDEGEQETLPVSCCGSWLAANLANLAVLANDFFFFPPPCRRGGIVHCLSLAGELHTGLGGPGLSLGEENVCLFHYFLLYQRAHIH